MPISVLSHSEIADTVFKTGICVCPDYIDPSQISALSTEIDLFQGQQLFKTASIGRGQQTQHDPTQRLDKICWLDPLSPTVTQKILWTKLEDLKTEFNRKLYLGLWEFEGHYAIYPPGAYYRKHLDRFSNSDLRVLSIVLYLNTEWAACDGGELRIYNESTHTDIMPQGGTLVCFLSASIEHEVLTNSRTRKSLTGWFRRRQPLSSQVY